MELGWGRQGRSEVGGQDPRLNLFPASGTMSLVSVPCHVKGTVALQVGDVRTSQGRPGVLVIDVTFPSVAPFEVSKPRERDQGSWAGLTRKLGRVSGVNCFHNASTLASPLRIS